MLTNKESHIALAASISFCIGFLMACAPEKKLTGSVADLQGTWVASCAYSETTNFYKEAKYVVSGRSISYEGNYYFDALCDNVSSKQMSFYTNLNVGDEVTLDNGTNGNRFSYNVQSYQLTPMDVNVVQTSNDYSYCGVDTWEIEKALEVSGKTCLNPNGEWTWPAKNKMVKNVYHLSDNKLFIGLGSDSEYPTAANALFVKQ